MQPTEAKHVNTVLTDIKEEISWNVHEYGKDVCPGNFPATPVDSVDLCDDSDDDVIIIEPIKKRHHPDPEFDETLYEPKAKKCALDTTISHTVPHPSRSDQLCHDLMSTQSTTSAHCTPNILPSAQIMLSKDDIVNGIITEITKWNYKWIVDQEPNPVQYWIAPCQPKFIFDFASYQR